MVFKSLVLTITLFIFSGCGSDGGSTSASSSNVEAEIESESGYTFKEGNLITLDGDRSFGSIENYKFYYDGGILCESSRSTCQTTDISVGTHKIYLEVSNSEKSDTDFITIQIEAKEGEKDSEPITGEEVELKASIEVLGGSTFEDGEYVVFNGGESKGDIVRYEFSYSGGSLCESDNTTCRTNQIPAGQYKIHLTVYDINGKSDSAFDFITVKPKEVAVVEPTPITTNKKPVANFITSSTLIEQGKEIVLSSSSTDDKGVVSYQWSSSRDGSLGDSENLKVSNLSVGVHTITLIVKDKEGLLDSTTKQITVNSKNRVEEEDSSTVTFDYSNNDGKYTIVSKDSGSFTLLFTKASDEEIYIYNDPADIIGVATINDYSSLEKFENGGVQHLNSYDYSSRVITVREFGLAVFKNRFGYLVIYVLDIQDNTRSDLNDIVKFQYKVFSYDETTVENLKPTANFTASKTSITEGDSITFSSSSTDDKKITSFEWKSSINGSLSSFEQFSTKDLSVGTHQITLTVYDSEGRNSSTSKTVTVLETVDEVDYGRKFLNVPRSYTRNGDVVTDNVSGLKWEDQSDIFEGTFSEAENYCSNLTLGGITDWRVPTLKELWYLADRSRSNPAIDPVFQSTKRDYYWTSQKFKYYEERNWVVNFSEGYDSSWDRMKNNFAHCVSGESNYEKIEFEKSGSTVKDLTHNLQWQDSFNKDTLSWSNAIDFCKNLTYENFSNWRLPTIEELASIVNFEESTSPFHSYFNGFHNFTYEEFSNYWMWSSSKVNELYSYEINLKYGSIGKMSQDGEIYTICVRDM